MGKITMRSPRTYAAGSLASIELLYECGPFGIDDTGGLKISFRVTSDIGRPQFTDPLAEGYTTAEASNGAPLSLLFDRINIRPYSSTIYIRSSAGFLRPGDSITIRIGDTRSGGPGVRVPTNAERAFPIKAYVDAFATYEFVELGANLSLDIEPDIQASWIARLPTTRKPGEAFRLHVLPVDRWGNPTSAFEGAVRLRSSPPVIKLPGELHFARGRFGATVEGLTAAEPGDYSVTIEGATDGDVLCRSTPLRVAPEARSTFWADFHGQSGETIGSGTAEEYFAFARDLADLDIVGHQGNDFQITDAFWQQLNDLTRAFNDEGRFVTIPGYEWSGNTGVGGDRNVFYAREDEPIYRSSHVLVPDGDETTACPTVSDLFEKLRAKDALTFAHCGGRYADLRVGHDGRVETAVEIHSCWGTFEWLLHDALKLGHRVGVVCNSDDHKGRPGASGPGASVFGAIGGLTCVYANHLTRDHVLEALRRRHHYGTTGARLHLDVRARFEQAVIVHDRDPALGPATTSAAREIMMGDIVLAHDDGVLQVDVVGAAPIERITIFEGVTAIATKRTFSQENLGTRIRIVWEGAEYRGRARRVTWDGSLRVAGNVIEHAAPINFFNPNKPMVRHDDGSISWRVGTTGNNCGVDVWLRSKDGGDLSIDTPQGAVSLRVSDIQLEEHVVEFGGLGKRLRAFRLPEELHALASRFTIPIENATDCDRAYYVRVTQEDGHQAWSSPIYLIPPKR